uniref:RIMS-binding protein 2 n=1 Tax=Denticeps clupeoides TaxID=299321 RepID=A0AAY4EM96_9TELE
MQEANGADYSFLVRQNAELLRALEELEKTCATLRDENGLLRKSSCPETEEKVKRLRRKNTELALIAKRLEDRAHKLQEANMKVVNVPMPVKPGVVEQYKRAFARQRARDLAQHADSLLSKDKEIAALQQECRQLEARLGQSKDSPDSSAVADFERLLRESQKEVLRLQRQLSVSSTQEVKPAPDSAHDITDIAVAMTPPPGPSPAQEEEPTEEQRVQFLESELSKKRKECEGLEHEVRKRQKRCQDLESQLEEECSRNERLEEETQLLRRKAQLLEQVCVEEVCTLGVQYRSALDENQKLRAKLENLEQVLKHMREVAERRQKLELEHEQALAILKFKQEEIKRLQRAQLFAKREHEGVVQMLEVSAKVRELEGKCRSQSEQFSLLSQELDRFRLHAAKIDLASSGLLSGPALAACLSVRTCVALIVNKLGVCRFEMTSSANSVVDLEAVLTTSPTPIATGLARPQRSPATKHRELPTLGNTKSTSTSSTPKSDSAHLTPKSGSHPHSPRKVDTASEVEELDIDVSPAPYSASRGAAKLQVFIARYSYNPYDGPNDNPEVELPLTAGEYIYMYGDMDDDGFYEGELMDGRRGLVPSNFVERVSDDDIMNAHPPETGELSHNSFQDSSFHSSSFQPGPSPSPTHTAPVTNGLDLDLEEVGVDTVPYPRKLTLIKQLAKSAIIGWDAPAVPAGWGSVWSYNVYVDQELRLNVPFGSQTKAVLERLDVATNTYRVSVQSLTDRGGSDQLRCTMLVGQDACVAPSALHVDRVTATSATLTWLPSNSNYVHVVSLNEEECELVKAGCYSLCLANLAPSLRYQVKVEARPHRTPWEMPPEQRERKAAVTCFSTLTAGPPDAPLDVQLEQGPSAGIALVSWLPVTIDATGTSNGVSVTGYTIYADKKKVLEVASPTAGSALLGPSQIQSLQSAQELTVRTMSAHGESPDSVAVNVQAKLPAIMTGTKPSCPPVPALSMSIIPFQKHITMNNINTCFLVLHLLRVMSLISIADGEDGDGCFVTGVVMRFQGYSVGLMEPSNGPQADSSRGSDLSDILEEEEEDLYSESAGEVRGRGYSTAGATGRPDVWELDSDEEVLERILKLPAQTCNTKQLFSIPEVTEEEDNSAEEAEPRRRLASRGEVLARGILRQHLPSSLTPPKRSAHPARPRPQLRPVRRTRQPGGLVPPVTPTTPHPRQRPPPKRGSAPQPHDLRPTSGYSCLTDSRPLYRRRPLHAEPDHPPGEVAHRPRRGDRRRVRHRQRRGPRALRTRLVRENEMRIFVALFPYDPVTMSPNPDAAEEELPFQEGQIIKVYGDKDADGFYHGESSGRLGYVPCNMVSEIQVEDEETREQLLQQGFLSTDASMEKIGARSHARLPRRPVPPAKPRRSKKGVSPPRPTLPATDVQGPGPRRMVAIFDYDPRESSPNADIEAELTFSAGDVIYVFGDMDDDGFFYGELNGHKGLVPSNFLRAFPEAGEGNAGGAGPHPVVLDGRRDLQVSACGVGRSKALLLVLLLHEFYSL